MEEGTETQDERYLSIDAQITECQRMIWEQCQRLARQVDSGRSSGESNQVLYCLQQSLEALHRIRSLAE